MKMPSIVYESFDGDKLRARIFWEKYALRNTDNEVIELTPTEMWHRVASEAANCELPQARQAWEDRFNWMLSDWRVVPGGRILHALGNSNNVTAQNCYVLPSPYDSIESIYDTAKNMAIIYKRGGGVGVDISTLRPRGAFTKNVAHTSTGAVSWMELFSQTTGIVGQQGRRGALMLTIADSHPDVLDFCKVKRNLNQVRNANISVRISDKFMWAVAKDDQWRLYYENPNAGVKIERIIAAKELWDELIDSAWQWAEPGLLFWDTIKSRSVTEIYSGHEVVSTNPCGEQPLEPYGNCCLAAVNLAAHVLHPFASNAMVNMQSLKMAVEYGVRFLDNVITWNHKRHPLPEQSEVATKLRRIGLGILGLADMLAMLGLEYGSPRSLASIEYIMYEIKLWAYNASANLAESRGAFPLFNRQHFSNPYFDTFPVNLLEKMQKMGLRNASLLTVAPTGTTAALVGRTSGIEPIFDIKYTRKVGFSTESFEVEHPLVQQYYRASEQDKLPGFFKSAYEITYEERLNVQRVVQEHIDQAVSSTINLPKSATRQDISYIYKRAHVMGLKGVTVYRDGSREGVLIPTSRDCVECELPDMEKA